MVSRTSSQFRDDFAKLPLRYRRMAQEAYRRFKHDPNFPALNFKKLPPHEDIWSVRIGTYRAVGRWRGDVMLWFFIGSHADYDKLIQRM
jgi:mRNA-degrading endonuclease RelE of RelBE toxin-antitoxin system